MGIPELLSRFQSLICRGRVIQKVQIDKSESKSNELIGLLSKLCFKKKSRADIVKLVASGDLASSSADSD